MNPCRVYSWNINGIRAATRKGLDDWICASRAEIIGLQEIRADLDLIPSEILELDEYQHHYVVAERKFKT